MSWFFTLPGNSYEEAREELAWGIPEDYNLAEDLIRKHEDAEDRVGLVYADSTSSGESFTFDQIDQVTNRFANGLESLGLEFGDRIAVMGPQRPETIFTHIACWKMGAISITCSTQLGTEITKFRLNNSGAKAIVVSEGARSTVEEVRDDCPELEFIIEMGSDADGEAISFDRLCAAEGTNYDIANTTPDTPAMIVYTSGTTGEPKGVLLRHSVVIGYCPAYLMYFAGGDEREVLGDAVFWTPADWGWVSVPFSLPTWHYGCTLVAYERQQFVAKKAFEVMESFDVNISFLPPTALRMMMEIDNPTEEYDLTLERVCAGGEPVTSEIIDWAHNELDMTEVNESYGQTEANQVIANCPAWFEPRSGSMGKAVPGHEVQIIDRTSGEVLPCGEVGEIAVKRKGDPTVFLEYWNNPEKTERTRLGEWHLTGDLAKQDEDGYFWFQSRADDLIITSGYRVSPREVEDCILEHEAVEQAGVIGIDDPTRGTVIKAFVQSATGVTDSEELKEEIQMLVRRNLAKYQYPRKIEFIEEIPLTVSGKVRRTELRSLDNKENN